jgi:hypothetical protein
MRGITQASEAELTEILGSQKAQAFKKYLAPPATSPAFKKP